MDFIFDNLIFIIFVAGVLAQWRKASQEAKAEQKAREEEQQETESFEEFVEEAVRRIPKAAVPPSLPSGGAVPMPGAERSPVPDLRRSEKRVAAEAPPLPGMASELARQAAIAEQVRELKRAKKAARPAFDNRKKVQAEVGGGIGLKARLNSRRELQDAFVLKEILEKPVGLR